VTFTPTAASGVRDAYPQVAQFPPPQACLPKAWDVIGQRIKIVARLKPGARMIDLFIGPR
jgi:hypothetical protein